MKYEEQRERVINIQNLLSRVNHKLENPKIRLLDSLKLQDEKIRLQVQWDREIRIMWAMPEYNGRFKLQAQHLQHYLVLAQVKPGRRIKWIVDKGNIGNRAPSTTMRIWKANNKGRQLPPSVDMASSTTGELNYASGPFYGELINRQEPQ